MSSISGLATNAALTTCLAARVFTARLTQASLVTKTDFDDKVRSLNQKINSNKTKHLLVFLKKQSMYRYFKRFAGVGSASYIYFQKSKGLSDANNTAPARTSIHNSLNSQLIYLFKAR